MEDLEQGLGAGLEVDEHGVVVARRGARGAPLLGLGDPVELRVAGHGDDRRRWRLELAIPPGR